MRRPKWKQRQLAERAEREAAEKKAREDAFWRAVEPKLIEDQPDTFVRPIDYSELGALW